ncbi:DHA2 family efflux MFS transporter permease subunit [Paenibacillus psychroresistens]|uniref:DHA2 family efflux MFS transporter permease subunit n=1 Tax=Paenibacillus psychroresistens TaxID=1778678 RepID=A0A6B8RI09_9BACL|nr:MDR family MFS transporter [Paenibacillus psychroresistens]QGQ95235.1 DHA2 family efflux MFS transporter permease subunit [Paenibacillus psychroresistens]
MSDNKKNNKALIITGLMIGIIFAELDETVVSTAMPTIVRDLGGLSLYGWVAGIYMLAMTSFIPILGKLADLYGRKRIYVISMGLFIAGSVISGFSTSMTVLLIGRGIQGIGAGGLLPLALVIFGDSFTVEERAKTQGIFGAFMFIPQLLGPLIGGYLTQHISWHWIFWVNIPVGIVAAFVLSAGLRESTIRDKKVSVDWAGAFLLVGSILALLLTPVLHQNEGYAWDSSVIVGLWVLGAVLLSLFIYVESKAKEPILPLDLFKNRTFVVLSLIVFTMVLGIMGAFAAFPFYAQNVIGLTPIVSGYLSLPLMVGAILASVISGRLITKVPYKYIFAVSMLLPAIGFYLMTNIDIHTKIIAIICYFFILGLGFGIMFNNNLIIQESVPKEQSGIALSSVTLFQSIGMTVGLSIFGSLLASKITSGIGGLMTEVPADSVEALKKAAQGGIPKGIDPSLAEQIKIVFADAFRHLYWVSFGVALVVCILCWFLKKEVLATAPSIPKQNEQASLEA